MAVIQEISLDVKKLTQFAKFRIQQGNAMDMKVDVLITEDGEPYIIPDTAQVILRMLKKDGKPIFNTCDKLGENKVQFTITPEISVLDGRCPAKIQIVDSATGGDLRTIEFHMLIDKDVYEDSLITSTGEYTALQDALLRVGDVSSVVTNAENATADAIEATQNATDSTLLANTATDNANLATANANDATDSANTAALTANTSATNADIATGNANQAISDMNNLNQTVTSQEDERQDFYNAYKVCEPYNSSKQYIVANKVTYGGSTYQCILDCSGVVPTNITNWLLVASKGADGTGGDMMATVYDPTGKANDAYDSANHSYSNTTSNLSSTNAQSAIDELDSNIGDLSLLNTTSNTDLVGAINEINSKPSGGGTALSTIFDNTESGLVAENVQDAIDEHTVSLKDIAINVKGFGALGNSNFKHTDNLWYTDSTHTTLANDDTIAIQAAVDYASINGGKVYFPSGYYKITSTLIINMSGVSLMGDGISKTKIFTELDIDILHIGTYDYSVDGAHTPDDWLYFFDIEGITFKNMYGANNVSTGINLRAIQFANIKNCRFENLKHGISIHECSHHNEINNNDFVTYEAGIYINSLGNTANYNSTGNKYLSNSFLSGLYGILINGVSFGDIVIANNVFVGTTTAGISATKDATTSYYATKIGIYNNDFDGSITTAISLIGCNNCIIGNNNIAPHVTTGKAILLSNCNHCTVNSNNVLHALIGIDVVGGQGHIISNNIGINIVQNALILNASNSLRIIGNSLVSTGDCVVISNNSIEINFVDNAFSSTSGKDISSSVWLPSNTIKSRGNFYMRAGSSYFGDFKSIIKITNITSKTVYSYLSSIYLPTYSACYVEITFTGMISGGGVASRKVVLHLLRSDTSVAITTVSDTAYGATFEMAYDKTTSQDYTRIGFMLGESGTALNGQALIEVKGMVTSIPLPTY